MENFKINGTITEKETISQDVINNAIKNAFKSMDEIFSSTPHDLNDYVMKVAKGSFIEINHSLVPAGVVIMYFTQSADFVQKAKREIPEGMANLFSNMFLEEFLKIDSVKKYYEEVMKDYEESRRRG